jgi:hypothetical protein
MLSSVITVIRRRPYDRATTTVRSSCDGVTSLEPVPDSDELPSSNANLASNTKGVFGSHLHFCGLHLLVQTPAGQARSMQ